MKKNDIVLKKNQGWQKVGTLDIRCITQIKRHSKHGLIVYYVDLGGTQHWRRLCHFKRWAASAVHVYTYDKTKLVAVPVQKQVRPFNERRYM